MTASPAAPGVSDATIIGWQASGLAYLAAAARLAPRYGVGTCIINLATMVLEGHGLVTRTRWQYFLAPPTTRPAGPPATGPQAPGPAHPPCRR